MNNDALSFLEELENIKPTEHQGELGDDDFESLFGDAGAELLEGPTPSVDSDNGDDGHLLDTLFADLDPEPQASAVPDPGDDISGDDLLDDLFTATDDAETTTELVDDDQFLDELLAESDRPTLDLTPETPAAPAEDHLAFDDLFGDGEDSTETQPDFVVSENSALNVQDVAESTHFLDRLFADAEVENLSFDSETETEAEPNLDAELDALFDTAAAETAAIAQAEAVHSPTLEPPPPVAMSPEPPKAPALDPLGALPETPPMTPPVPVSRELPVSAPPAPAKPQGDRHRGAITQDFFTPLAELETLLEATLVVPSPDWQALQRAIVGGVQTTIPEPAAPSPSPEKAEEDHDFGDLEDLLQEADNTMGGSPSSKAVTARLAPKRQRANVFEQTMRIPVKQLDLLSNLMGELVVNRNTLEQGQDRLRQFLENLTGQVQNLSDVGGRMQDLYERSLLESSLLASRQNQGHRKDQRYSYGGSSIHHEAAGRHHQGAVVDDKDEDYDPLEMDRFTGFHLLSQEMIELIVRVRESASDIQFLVDETEQIARNLRQVTTQLQEGMNKSRMVPFAQTADRLPRAIRDISIKLKKKAELQVEGREILIDKMILQELYDPMTHLVNNAITHGIETPAEREERGKAPTGRITIKAFVQGNQTIISIADDGAGINSHAIKRKAIEKGLITPQEAAKLSKQEIFSFIFNAGFSTKDQADDFAGRGVGMDVVQTAIASIRGSISIDSQVGQGTTFNIRLPLTLSICKALCCLSSHARIAFPMDGVEDMQDYGPKQVKTLSDGSQTVCWRDLNLPLKPLQDLVKYNRQLSRGSVYGGNREEEKISVVILRSGGNLLAVKVDQVLGEQEIVIKQIEGPIPKPAGISGATVLGDGSIMPIADILELMEIAQGLRRNEVSSSWHGQELELAKATQPPSEPMVLIVDDSVTVRALASMSFNKSGYRVEQARDGQEAWEKLSSGLPCDLVFCDIEMPRLDGLELLKRMQEDEELATIPVAMLTSRGSTKMKDIAAQRGACAYFTKPYLEEALLDAADKMMNGEVLLANSVRPQGLLRRRGSSSDPETSNPTAIAPEAQEETTAHGQTPVVAAPAQLKANPKVLIIDDSVTVRELLGMTFDKAGYIVEKARDGQDALDQLLKDPKFDLVFCDIEMPRIDGLELLNRLREHEELTTIPVAMLTSRGAEKHRRIAADRGAKGYFTKPYVEDNLLDAAHRLILGEVLLRADGSIVE